MTQLRKMTLEELERRNYSQATARTYIDAIRQFAAHFHRSPDQLGPLEIREYQLHLYQRKLHPQTIRVQTAAHEIGNGVYTVLAQLAAERLGVPLASVTVEVGDTNVPPAPVAGGSNSTGVRGCSKRGTACSVPWTVPKTTSTGEPT